MRRSFIVSVLIIVFCSTALVAQDGYFANWFERSDRNKAEQPHWVTPVATVTPRLEQEVRYDQLWQQNAQGVTTNNYGGGKGLELIPFNNVEVIFNVPPYIDHNSPTAKNGWGDTSFLVKYRMLSANEEHGNYIVTAFLGWSIPTGTYKNGAEHAVITPTIAYGKGFGNFDAQGTFGVAMPVADTNRIGRTYNWNNAFQYRVFRKLWPEVEINSSFYQDGPRDGKKQTFITPGLLFGRFQLTKRVGMTFGGGFQIAATRFHTTNHNGIFTARFPF
jgi:hypothetical protein